MCELKREEMDRGSKVGGRSDVGDETEAVGGGEFRSGRRCGGESEEEGKEVVVVMHFGVVVFLPLLAL